MQKQKRVEGKATLDITGRDQADQKLHLQFDQDTFLWNMTKAENKITAPPPDEVLEKTSALLRLSMAGVEAELSNVKKLINRVFEFVEKIGFKAQLEKFLNQKIDKVR